MRILLLSDPNNPHTLRWLSALEEKGISVGVFGLDIVRTDFYEKHPSIAVFTSNKLSKTDTTKDGGLRKITYLFCVGYLKKVISEFAPDILHAHYASSYGLLGVLSGFHPLVLSVWGSDIYCFPKTSFVHKRLLKIILDKCDYLLSTSNSMARETHKYTDRLIEITPFGIDTELFSRHVSSHNDNVFTIGCTKSHLPIYGIDFLIRAFAMVRENIDARLVLVGDGPSNSDLKELARRLGLSEYVVFEGKKKIEELPLYYSMFDVAVFLSKSESFGVVALEAMGCKCPVVVSNTDGFVEVVPSKAGIFVNANDVVEVANAIIKIYNDKQLAMTMGEYGRNHVVNNYQWKYSVSCMTEIYRSILK